jgi:N-acetylglutamate synthase-like GNAT family acetyltransferase
MKLLVRTPGGRKEVECEFMDGFEATIINQWSGSVSGIKSTQQDDAVEFCQSVAAKWAGYEQKYRVVRSMDELMDRCSTEPEEESMGVLSARADWYAEGQVLAFCEFRRTWSNNIVFDFLAVRPDLLGGRPPAISGLGTALLCELANIARRLEVEIVWAETTSTSVGFYRKALNRDNFGDLLRMSRAEFCGCFGVRN